MRSAKSITTLAALLAGGTIPLVAHSQVYLTEEQAIGAIFPGEKLVRKSIDLTSDEIKAIEEHSGERVRNHSVIAWVSSSKKVVIIDQVLGKHEFITYAVGITPKTAIQSLEILEYRETYGYQVRGEAWRKQFEGKDVSSPLKLNQDIANISGATLSSAHITAGAKRVLKTVEVLRGRL